MSNNVQPIDINDEMRQSYLSYAMSVIVSRALPDARDGLKPVQRRILYAMHDMGMRPRTAHKKSARVVGEVLGKYHPHGDQSVYDAMVRMAQSFSLRYPLVDGQGNFGSIDGDAAAAMRYTEARMDTKGFDLMTDLEKDTVEFGSNFDETLKEPLVLPATLPNLLINGSNGIAVGMSTSIPPHNLAEVIDALLYMLDNWDRFEDLTLEDLMEFIKGPDFPTGGMLFRNRDGIDALAKSYASGRGRVKVRATVTIENIERNKSRLIITELPYQTNKTNLMERIANLHRDGKLEGLTDLRDESDRTGMRILIETTRNVEPKEVLRKLYKYTPMESTFSIIMLALVDGEPKVLTLKQALKVYLEHRLEIVRRRSEYDLNKARRRAHILKGLIKAIGELDTVIDIIRRSRSTDTAHTNLCKKLELSNEQATAILNMQLRRLAALERRKLQDEYKEVSKVIKSLESLLNSPQDMRITVGDELKAMREQYADTRRTLIVEKSADKITTAADLVANEKCWVVIGENGTIARTQDDELFTISGRPPEQPYQMLEVQTKDILYTVAANGEVCSRFVYDLPKATQMGEGEHWTTGTQFAKAAQLAAAMAIPQDIVGNPDGGFLFMTTVGGSVKRIRVQDLPGVTDQPFTLIRVDKDDALGWVKWTTGAYEILLATAVGQTIRFGEEEVRSMGLKAGGVAGIKLKSATDKIIGMEAISPAKLDDPKTVALVWSITDNGLAKATPLSEYPRQKRNGQGVSSIKLPKSSEAAVAMVVGNKKTEIYVKTKRKSCKRMRLGKAEQGRRALRPKPINGLSISASNRVIGAVKASQVKPESIEKGQQLSLI
ncbi:MAG: DNA gyrase/topoisomerase IV subunit A [Candidatus Promineifilaceae bacterium]